MKTKKLIDIDNERRLEQLLELKKNEAEALKKLLKAFGKKGSQKK